jgi:NADP-dependent 3-hydroxy acid dehydrogenase YdfG
MHAQQTIFITGAGSGIGAAAARLFSSRGWFVGLYDRDLESVRKLAAELGDGGCFGYVDVTDRQSVDWAMEGFSQATGGRLDVMLNNAGLFQDERFVDADRDYLERMMRVNMDGVVNGARAAYPLLKATPGAHLVNMGSASSIYGVPNSAVYSATKFFVRGLTEALRIEWEEDDIVVNVVMPSYVATPMTDGIKLSHDHSGKLLSADEIATAVWQAAAGRGMYWVLPKLASFQWGLLRKMPLSWVPAISRKIFIKGLQK